MAEKPENPTKEQIAEWKRQFGKVFLYKTADGKTCYFRPPTRKIIAAASVFANGDSFAQQDTVARNCAIGGDLSILSEDKYLYSLGQKLDSMIEQIEGALKEV